MWEHADSFLHWVASPFHSFVTTCSCQCAPCSCCAADEHDQIGHFAGYQRRDIKPSMVKPKVLLWGFGALVLLLCDARGGVTGPSASDSNPSKLPCIATDADGRPPINCTTWYPNVVLRDRKIRATRASLVEHPFPCTATVITALPKHTSSSGIRCASRPVRNDVGCLGDEL